MEPAAPATDQEPETHAQRQVADGGEPLTRTQTSVEIDLAEFDRLRHEIDRRIQIAMTLVVAQIAALGAGLSVVGTVHDVLLAAAAVSPFLWLLWLDNSIQIHTLGGYVAIRLAPRLRETDHRAFTWEAFYRQVHAGREPASRALGIDIDPPLAPGRHTTGPITALFGGSPLVLLAIYLLVFDWGSAGTVEGIARFAGIGVVGVALVLAWQRRSRYRHLIDAVSMAVMKAGEGRL